MTIEARGRLMGMVLAMLLAARPAAAQAPDAVPPPAPMVPAPPAGTTLGPPTLLPSPAPYPPPAPPPPPAPALGLEPNPYGVPFAEPLFFFDGDLQILKPQLKAALSGPVTSPGGITETVQPPTTSLNWTVAPHLEGGYFIPGGLGFFALNYRFLGSNGHASVVGLDGTPYDLRTRLDVNQITFDYGLLPYSFAPRWDVLGRIGFAVADVFFDNQAVGGGQTLYTSNNFLGAGPHVRLDVRHHFGLLPGLDLFGRADLQALVGQVRQRFSAQLVAPDGTVLNPSIVQKSTETTPVFTVQAGLTYTPPAFSNWHFSTGYQFEEWWFVGEIDGNSPREQLYTNGVFLRAMVEF